MTSKSTKAAPFPGRRFDFETALQAGFDAEVTTPRSLHQEFRAANLLAARYGLPVPTACLVAELAGIGGAR